MRHQNELAFGGDKKKPNAAHGTIKQQKNILCISLKKVSSSQELCLLRRDGGRRFEIGMWVA